MIKGCNKSVIYMKNTESDVFDEAYFILRNTIPADAYRECDMVREAERIIREGSGQTHASTRRPRSIYSFVMGVVCSVVFYTVLGIIIFYTG